MIDAAWVMLGSALGGVARHWLSGAVARSLGETFPWGTMAVNVSGAFVIGIFASLALASEGWLAAEAAWRFSVLGFLGSYTTVSSFSLQTLALARDGERWRAAGNVAASVALCLLAAALGLAVGTLAAGG
jgi:fluoride exporter